MIVKTLTLGEFQTNCYLVFEEKTKEGLIIDPADDANFISEQILLLRITPKSIIATHGHFDHLLAAWELQLAFNIPFYIHQEDLFLLKNMEKSAKKFSSRKIIEKNPTDISFLKEGQTVSLGQENLKVIHTPGHTPGSICLVLQGHLLQAQNLLFSGDTLFSNSVGRTDLSYSSKTNLKKSLEKIFSLPCSTLLYPGHGLSSSLEIILAKKNTPAISRRGNKTFFKDQVTIY